MDYRVCCKIQNIDEQKDDFTYTKSKKRLKNTYPVLLKQYPMLIDKECAPNGVSQLALHSAQIARRKAHLAVHSSQAAKHFSPILGYSLKLARHTAHIAAHLAHIAIYLAQIAPRLARVAGN